ncbi:MAG TPA: hypothetical protein VJ770_14625 [Stellaceae bacterium]|nr:hypothetical protein [Stellaceae bacterium]
MRLPTCFWVAAALAASAVFQIDTGRAQSRSPVLDRPPIPSIGDAFTYQYNTEIITYTYLGLRSGQSCYSAKIVKGIFSPTGGELTVCVPFGQDAVIASRQVTSFSAYPGTLAFPLFIGKQWQFSYHGKPREMPDEFARSAEHVVEGEVTAYEPVTVPGGTFDAFKIEGYDSDWGNPDLKPFLAYYSPKVGFLKWDGYNMYGTHLELLRYLPVASARSQ